MPAIRKYNLGDVGFFSAPHKFKIRGSMKGRFGHPNPFSVQQSSTKLNDSGCCKHRNIFIGKRASLGRRSYASQCLWNQAILPDPDQDHHKYWKAVWDYFLRHIFMILIKQKTIHHWHWCLLHFLNSLLTFLGIVITDVLLKTPREKEVGKF